MQGKIFCGGQMGVWCLRMEIRLRKYIGKRCLTKIGQVRQGFDACRAVSLCGGQTEKANAGFVDARGNVLVSRLFVAFRAKLGPHNSGMSQSEHGDICPQCSSIHVLPSTSILIRRNSGCVSLVCTDSVAGSAGRDFCNDLLIYFFCDLIFFAD